MKNYVQPGNTITLTAPYAIASGDGLLVGSIFGIGFPANKGGVAQFIENYEGGVAGFIARAQELADSYGERFRPSAWLVERAGTGRGLAG